MSLPVSCIVTSFNNADTLAQAVASVLSQTAPVSEIVIADDASTDGSRDLIATLAADDPRITPILRDRNLGVSRNRDLALRSARLPFVTHLDGDDRFARGKLAAEWRALDGRDDRIAFSDIALVHPGRPWRTSVLSTGHFRGRGAAVVTALLIRRRPIPRDMLLSKALFERAGGFTPGVDLYEDWDLKLRLALEDTEWVPTGTVGTLYMQWPGGLSRLRSETLHEAQAEVVRARLRALEASLGRPGLATALGALFGRPVDEADIAEGRLPVAPATARPRRFWQGALNRLRALRHLPATWPARHG